MNTKQPEALTLAQKLENAPAWESQSPTIYGWNDSGETLADAAAELRRLHSDHETLHESFDTLLTGYDAARLGIASLQAQLESADDRLRDMLLADDGQADKEARKYLERRAQPAAQALHVAATSCPHEIDKDKIVLHFDSKQPGKNALAQLAARLQAAQAVPAPGVEAVSEREFKQFLSDVLTAAGLVTHGKKCKDLGRRLGEMSMRLLTAPKTAAAPTQAGEYPKLPDPAMFDAVDRQGNPVSHGYSASQVRAIIDADRAARAVYSRSMDLVRVFWQQHTQAYALSMTMAELHDDVELVIRAARGAVQAAPRNGALAAPAQPRDDAVFVVWWSDHMPNSTEADAWAEWCAERKL